MLRHENETAGPHSLALVVYGITSLFSFPAYGGLFCWWILVDGTWGKIEITAREISRIDVVSPSDVTSRLSFLRLR